MLPHQDVGHSDGRLVSVLLFNLPRPVEEIVRKAVESDPDMELLGHCDDELELLLAVKEMKANVVALTIQAGNEQGGLSSHLFAEYPNLVILGVNYADGTVVVEQSCPIRRLIPDWNPETLSREIRRAVLSPCS